MRKRTIISDASTIIGLKNINSLNLLRDLYGQIEITSIVEEETSIDIPNWFDVNDNYNQIAYRSLIPNLDRGEASSIALAMERSNVLLIIDERKGRWKAQALGIKITGLAGIIIRAKNEGMITSGKEKLDQLIASGFRLSSNIYSIALEKMGED